MTDIPPDDDGEIVDLGDEDPAEVTDTDDGGAIVKIGGEKPKAGDSPFYANLAEDMSQSELNTLGSSFIELIEKDKEARKQRDEKYAEGLKRTGLGDDAPGGADFSGASKVVHPMLTEVCVDFSSRAIKEICPAGGPAKSQIISGMTPERLAKATKKTTFLNWQLMTQSQDFRAELEQLLTQVPLGGSQYMKISWNAAKNRPNFLFIAIDDMYLPYAATNFYSAERKTHVQYLTKVEYDKRVREGMYLDIDLTSPGMMPDQSKAAKANDKIEGREDDAYNSDGLRTVFEIYAICDLPDPLNDDAASPYIITVDKNTSRVLSIYRNWDEDDDAHEEMAWIVEFPFVPWRGVYAIGIVHMIGGLSAAATGALRALMDSAHIANSQTMLKLKGGSAGGQTLNIQPTQVLEIEGSVMADDVRKIAMPLPFNQPSQTLYQLLGFLVEAGKGVVRTTMDDVSESNQNVPVGTTLAKIEQGMVVYSAIHARLHAAMGRVLMVLHRLNAMYLDDTMEIQELGEDIAKRSDFTGPVDVVPVSDPNIFSEAQRFAQMQAVQQRADLHPELYDARKVEDLILSTLKIPDGQSLLRPAMVPTEDNAVTENVKASLGKPVVAFPDQDHIAHLKTHLSYMLSPSLGSSRLIGPKYLQIMLGHLAEHVALWYSDAVFEEADDTGKFDLQEVLKEAQTKDDKQALDQMLAEASLNVVKSAAVALAPLPPAITQAISTLQSLAPPPPQDPATMVAMQDVQARAKAAQDKLALDGQIAQTKAANDAAESQREAQTEQQAAALEQMRETHDTQMKAQDISTKIDIAEAENRTQVLVAEIQKGEADPDVPQAAEG